MKAENEVLIKFPSRSANEAFARAVTATFAAQLDPTLDELGDIKTAVSEAVTNCIVHAYPDRIGVVTLIERGYTYLSYGFILFYLLPTLLVGGYKIIRHKD